MTVGELIEALGAFPAEMRIVLPSDGYFSPLLGPEGGLIYLPLTEEEGDLYLGRLTDEWAEMGFTEQDVYDPDIDGPGGYEVVVLSSEV